MEASLELFPSRKKAVSHIIIVDTGVFFYSWKAKVSDRDKQQLAEIEWDFCYQVHGWYWNQFILYR